MLTSNIAEKHSQSTKLSSYPMTARLRCFPSDSEISASDCSQTRTQLPVGDPPRASLIFITRPPAAHQRDQTRKTIQKMHGSTPARQRRHQGVHGALAPILRSTSICPHLSSTDSNGTHFVKATRRYSDH